MSLLQRALLKRHEDNRANPHVVTAAQAAYDSTIPGFDPATAAAALDVLAGVHIVEMGSNANGEYVRWENGLQVCWHILEGTNTDPTHTSWHVEEGFVRWTIPASFVDELSVLALAGSPGWHSEQLGNVLDTDTTTIRSGPTSQQRIIPYRVRVWADGRIYVYAFAVGRWK